MLCWESMLGCRVAQELGSVAQEALGRSSLARLPPRRRYFPREEKKCLSDHDFCEQILGNFLTGKFSHEPRVGFRVRAIDSMHQDDWGKHWEGS